MKFNKEMIIPCTVLIFGLVGVLSWFAQDGNEFCSGVLFVFGCIFLFAIFIAVPAFCLASLYCSWAQTKGIGKPFVFLVGVVTVFWMIVYLIIWIKPAWGWGYVDFFKKFILPVIKLLPQT